MNGESENKPGKLYVVATPIGNLEDITLRALRILKEADLVAAEDTRHSKILLQAYDIATPLLSLHEHNEKERSALLVAKIRQGLNVAYISDAGTPCISDPGRLLAQTVLENHLSVIPVPGPSAAIAALSVCGFPADVFVFCGFPPARRNKRREFLESLRREEKSLVFYESPARITGFMQDAFDVLGDRQAVVAREMTKVFEELKHGRLSEIYPSFAASRPKGEFTVILRGYLHQPPVFSDDEIRLKLQELQKKENLSSRDAVAEIARQTGLSKKRVYSLTVKN